MAQAQLSERHLMLVVHLPGAKRKGVIKEEMAGTGNINALRHLESGGSSWIM